MSTIYMFLLLIIVGAIIGGLTNSLAIKMLFRPYKAVYLGKFKVPFTPGVIPKRQEEIAKQLGKLVMTQLITADSIERKLREAPFVTMVAEQLQTETRRFFEEKKSLAHLFPSQIEAANFQHIVEEKSSEWAKEAFNLWYSKKKQQTTQAALPNELINQIDSKLPFVTASLQEHIVDYLASEEGKAKIKEQIDRFFEGRGMMASMLNMFLGNQSLIEKVHPEFIKFLSQSSFRDMLSTMLAKEWDKLKNQTVGSLINDMAIDEQAMLSWINQTIENKVSFEALLHTPVDDLLKSEMDVLVNKIIPSATDKGLMMISQRAKGWLAAMDIESIVTEQVRNFSFQELEQVILMISKREFSMITYLGAFLGAIIGLFQGILMTVIG